MALSQVAGPFVIEVANDMAGREAGYSEWPGTDGLYAEVSLDAAGVWHESYGLVIPGTWEDDVYGGDGVGARGLCFVRPDGKTIFTGLQDSSVWRLAGLGTIADARQLAAMWIVEGGGGDATWSRCEPTVAAPIYEQHVLNRGTASTFGVLPDRIITADDWVGDGVLRITTVPLTDAGTDPWDLEYEFTGTSEVYQPQLAYAGQNSSGHHTWWIGNAWDGQLFLYDSETQEEVEGTRTCLGPLIDWWFNSFGFSVKHGLFFFVQIDWAPPYEQRVLVFSTEPVATSIAAPAIAGTLVRGRRAVVSTTVTGDYGEPCPGRVVTFSATTGTFLPEAALTDADGVARTVIQAPMTAPAGTETLTATLVE